MVKPDVVHNIPTTPESIMTISVEWETYHQVLSETTLFVRRGRVTQVIGLTIEAQGLQAQIGELCYISSSKGQVEIPAEVMGFRDNSTLLMPLGEMSGIGPGSVVRASGSLFTVPVGDALLGRVLDGLGRPIDGKGPIYCQAALPCGRVCSTAPGPPSNPATAGNRHAGHRRVSHCWQRAAHRYFCGSGVGKSTVMG